MSFAIGSRTHDFPLDPAQAAWPPSATYAVGRGDWLGREHDEPEHAYRNPFQRDRDRIVHSAAFRRLQGKMQVFTGDFGDYHRTRLTHTLEVTSIARTAARALGLNEDLAEALALLHDIGHPPFGHAGEDVLDEYLRDEGGFNHNDFALVLVRCLERRYAQFPGLNLSLNLLESQQWRADKSQSPPNLECQIVDLADSIAYNAHDLDDSLQIGLLQWSDVRHLEIMADDAGGSQLDPDLHRKSVVRQMLNEQVTDLIDVARTRLRDCGELSAAEVRAQGLRFSLSERRMRAKQELEGFLFQRVYRHPWIVEARARAQASMRRILGQFEQTPDGWPSSVQRRAAQVGGKRALVDYLAGMTDQFCLAQEADLST